ncbi:FirrV-1-I2 [Feldmannia irregularis virus a]|uniref:FirrV-1-I2 n=1 Tax=Feldmannia irregularis virus a TaxID=231992 RepID=Q6XLU4_9PHYC|nr:FirrV-1-I2 [Feldmannia irregularis virus a]AAR26967.1 FirrV-1-I2 [Feldmannia irregularis virus a]
MHDARFLDDAFRGTRISGPWRVSVWKKKDCNQNIWVFSEEHENRGACGLEVKHTDLTNLVSHIVKNTEGVHVFLEHFVHAVDVTRTCSSDESSTLTRLRNCLGIDQQQQQQRDSENRIHFIDPRTDLVAILPDGTVYQAVLHYAKHLRRQHKQPELKLLLYETFVHPLLSIVNPDGTLQGRLNVIMQKYMENMTPSQHRFLCSKWHNDVILNVLYVYRVYDELSSDSIGIVPLLEAYTDMVNKFTDLWLLANFFKADNDSMTGAIVYAGSKHSLHFEKYLAEMQYDLLDHNSNQDLSACLTIPNSGTFG